MADEIPSEYYDGVVEVSVSSKTLPHPERAEIYTMGECTPLPATDVDPQSVQSRILLYYGSFRALAAITAGFDWRSEAWETLTHELRHHLEWRARVPDLEAFDRAAEENFARQDGEPFDPLFYLDGTKVAEGVYKVEDDYFLDRVVRRVPPDVDFDWHGASYRVTIPDHATLPAHLSVDEVVHPPPGDLVLVLRTRSGLGGLLRQLRQRGTIFQETVAAMKRSSMLFLVLCLPGVLAAQHASPDSAAYRVGVVSESGDMLTWLRPAGSALVVQKVIPLGVNPADPDGPHNLAVAPDGGSYYVTLAHGTPFGSLWRFDARTDTVLGVAPLERFPTTITLTPDGEWAFVANSDFHGERPRVNPVTIVHTPTMTTIVHLPACDMPHGMRASRDGRSVWVSCMHSDEILELDAQAFEIRRRFKVGTGHPGSTGHEGHAPAPAAAGGVGSLGRECGPTFVSLSPDGGRVYVACNVAGTLQVWNAETGTLAREVEAGAGAYNVEACPDGRLVLVTNKKAQSVSVYDARTLVEIKRVRTTKPVVHGIAFSPDGARAFVSAESVGSDPGSVDVLDLRTLTIIGTIGVPAQPTGIAVLRR